MAFFFLLLLGVTVGMIGALMGIGGGLIVVPVFLYLLGFSVSHTVGTAMVIVFFNALSATIAYYRQRRIVVSAAWRFGLATIPGAILGGWASSFFSGIGFQVAFGAFLLLAAINMYRKNSSTDQEKGEILSGPPSGNSSKERMRWGTLASVFVGFFSSVMGIGGGIIHVPLMSQVLRYPIHFAVGTSSCILLISSAAGLLTHGVMGHVLWMEAISTGAGALLGAQFGAGLARKIAPHTLRMAFAVLVFCMGLKILSAAMI